LLVSFSYVLKRSAHTTQDRQPRSRTLLTYIGPRHADLESVFEQPGPVRISNPQLAVPGSARRPQGDARWLAGTCSPAGEGKSFFTMMAAFAGLERDIIHERTMAGPAAARAQGRAGGRPTVMDADKLAAAAARRARGESPAEIARAPGVSRAPVNRHLSAVAEKA
jgi:hypothetical protein